MPIPEVLRGHLRLPIIGAPMFIVSTPRLVMAQCKAGIVGAFPALNARPAAQLDDWLAQMTRGAGRISARQPAAPKSRPTRSIKSCTPATIAWRQDVALCVKHKAPIIITSLRPPAEVVAAVHGYGGVVFHDVINLRHAEKAAAQGVDGIIAVCAGAGGHAGLLSPFALVKQIREVYCRHHHPVRRHEHAAPIAGGPRFGCGPCVSGHALHRDRGGQCARRVQANAHRQRRRGHRLYHVCSAACTAIICAAALRRAGLDPDNLPEADKTKMNFGTGGNAAAKAWRISGARAKASAASTRSRAWRRW